MLKALYSDEGETRLNHRRCVASTWVMQFCTRMLTSWGGEWESNYLANEIRGWFSSRLRKPRHQGSPYSLCWVPRWVSQDPGLTSYLKDGFSYSTVSPSLHWSIAVYLTRGKIAPCWPTNSNLGSLKPHTLPFKSLEISLFLKEKHCFFQWR